jgi:hypothetical protein
LRALGLIVLASLDGIKYHPGRLIALDGESSVFENGMNP